MKITYEECIESKNMIESELMNMIMFLNDSTNETLKECYLRRVNNLKDELEAINYFIKEFENGI